MVRLVAKSLERERTNYISRHFHGPPLEGANDEKARIIRCKDPTKSSFCNQLQSPVQIGYSLAELAGTSKESSIGRKFLALRSVLSWG